MNNFHLLPALPHVKPDHITLPQCPIKVTSQPGPDQDRWQNFPEYYFPNLIFCVTLLVVHWRVRVLQPGSLPTGQSGVILPPWAQSSLVCCQPRNIKTRPRHLTPSLTSPWPDNWWSSSWPGERGETTHVTQHDLCWLLHLIIPNRHISILIFLITQKYNVGLL